MARFRAILLALALGAAATTALSSCGGGGSADLLPGTTADEINSNLDQVQQLVSEGDCVGAEDAVAQVTGEVEELKGVDTELKAALQQGAGRLSEVVATCEETEEPTEPSLEAAVEAEELEQKELEAEEKAQKEKKEKKPKADEPHESPSEEEGENLPPQANGKGKGHEEAPAPETSEEESSSGGVGPGVGVEE
jgi:hypothetical protein